MRKLQMRWVSLALSLLVVAFATFVWPTGYRDLPVASPRVLAARQNRFTGAVDVLTARGWEHYDGPSALPPDYLDEYRAGRR